MASKEEQEHMDRVAAMGCIACRIACLGETPAEIHHAGTKMGGGRDHKKTMPLCPIHHRIGDGSAKYQGQVSYQLCPIEFEEQFGTQDELLQMVERELYG